MESRIPQARRAVVIDRFGGTEELTVRSLQVPSVDAGEVLIALEAAGVGSWDPFEREGGYADVTGLDPEFPYVLGSEGTGVVAAVGQGVSGLTMGDRVCATSFLNPKGGFYADHAVVAADLVRPAPAGMTVEQSAAFSGVAATALRGLDDVLGVRGGEDVAIVGAGGGIGHTAVQLARLLGARVLAVASGEDGAALAADLGADAVVDGRSGAEAVRSASTAFAPAGLDATLITAGGEAAETVVATLRDGGRAAHPTGVEPTPPGRPGVDVHAFNGEPDADLLDRLQKLMASGPFTVHVARAFPSPRRPRPTAPSTSTSSASWS